MNIAIYSAMWFLPFVLPIAIYAAYSDLSTMKIPNYAVYALAIVYVIIGPIALPLNDYLMGYAAFAIVFVLGLLLSMGGAMGAGDAKFIIAASPFIAFGDMLVVLSILAANLLAAFATHRLAKHTAMRDLAPNWESWGTGKKFPMGFALSSSLVFYLSLALVFGRP